MMLLKTEGKESTLKSSNEGARREQMPGELNEIAAFKILELKMCRSNTCVTESIL